MDRVWRQRVSEAGITEPYLLEVVENAGLGLAVNGPDGQVIEVNRVLREMLGYDAEEFASLTLADMSFPEDFEADLAQFGKLLAGEQRSYQMTKRYKHKSGAVVWGKVTVTLVREPSGAPWLAIAVVEDITAQIKAEEKARDYTAALEAQNQRLRELDRLKSAFIDTVSHELRTPLTRIIGNAEFLEECIAGALNETQQCHAREILQGAERLRQLVDDLLDYARLEGGRFELRDTEGNLTWRVNETMTALTPRAEAAGVALRAELPADPVITWMDPARIGQVLTNLVDNAIKFTPPGGTVTVRLRPGPLEVRCEVADTGIGIAPEHQSQLFDRFYQADPGLTREHGGAGLGLAISKALVEAHGGTIGVESTPEVGTTVWFTLPLRQGPPDAP